MSEKISLDSSEFQRKFFAGIIIGLPSNFVEFAAIRLPCIPTLRLLL